MRIKIIADVADGLTLPINYNSMLGRSVYIGESISTDRSFSIFRSANAAIVNAGFAVAEVPGNSEVWAYERKPVEETVYDHESKVSMGGAKFVIRLFM